MVAIIVDKKLFKPAGSGWIHFDAFSEIRPFVSDNTTVRLRVGKDFADFIPGRDGAIRANCNGSTRHALKQKFNKIFK